MDETFVNPYTFVPFPSRPPVRKRPHGHLGDPNLLSGALHIRITAEAPLLVRNITRLSEGSDPGPSLPLHPDGTPFIPGSSLKGALRSLHETLANGCLRVFNANFSPTYRDSAESDVPADLRLAQVTQHDDPKQPPTIRLCDDEEPRRRVGQDLLQQLNSDGTLTSGQLLSIEDFKKGMATDAERNKHGKWMLFLSNASARETKHPYRAHVGKLTSHSADVSESAWQRFQRAVKGTDDQRTAQQERRGSDQRFVDVTFQYDPKQQGNAPELKLGWRYVASSQLSPGQPVWVRTDSSGQRVTDLRLAMIWRHPADEGDTAGERAEDFPPCCSVNKLCPSCRMFGSADVKGKDDEVARQNSYRGHVRFGDAQATTDVQPLEVTLPPMGAPRPGAGQFYLVNDPSTVGNAGKPPLREWSSSADLQERRRLRGRKYYWHTPPAGQEPPARGTAREHQTNEEMLAEAAAFPAGTEFTARLSFTDLDREQLGGLLAVLQPGLLLEREGLRHHLGGGRSLGYGTCSISLDREAGWVRYSGTRYGAPGPEVSLDDVAEFLDEFQRSESSKDTLQEIGPLVAKVLDPSSVDPDTVWYPPGASWSKRGEKEFDDGYDFWQQSSGAELKEEKGVRTGYPLAPLPDVSAPDQSLPIVKDDQSVELPRQKPLPGDR
ncbi:CRISPR-associated protein (TIGR03986 family) [Saccharopolyspora lacisalsi]|uniref:CRISPR-associated protein (TIGR03986 family) n=1 Tax=Halosaccharopolyspora lacisalsi TaxID=1000566 RepID=A0A839DX17_9PSEU|nr:TIGR03986 family CRISPR-associated RAMP protein [Halosaccharopolyspora lacisalsi]MBA8825289.1 CRISPR-associated protein (TIGR03986 family) [Halosaccharopolyspora lacisalsi]